ncbi:hypothetical protein CVU37_10250 [candidate division BRC1 bacterium HGW-BRC1-1]|jgi:thioredoxin 1|nr:MAG: hypothetical protein CVU37_10250 [candidate division BRC1 bacterium HGW-BRC1-1]
MDEPNNHHCPKCGHESADLVTCEACGALFEKVRQRKLNEEVTEMVYGTSPYTQSDIRPERLPLWQKAAVFGVLLMIVLAWGVNRLQNAPPGADGLITFSSTMVPDGRPAVAKFHAEWCGPCKVYAPMFDQTVAEYGDRLKVARIDIDKNPDVARSFGVKAVPTTILFDKNGKNVETILGAVPPESLKTKIDKLF